MLLLLFIIQNTRLLKKLILYFSIYAVCWFEPKVWVGPPSSHKTVLCVVYGTYRALVRKCEIFLKL